MIIRRASAGRVGRLAESVAASGYASIVVDRLARQACELVDADGSCLVVRDRACPEAAIAVAGCGSNEGVVGDRPVEDDVLAEALESGRVTHSPRGATRGCERLAVPIRRNGRVDAALSADAPDRRSLGDRELGVLSEIAVLAGAALDHAEQRAELLSRVCARVLALLEAIDMRDRDTADHSESVVRLSCALGEQVGLGPPDLLELELAAHFHDLGKVAIPDAILRKPGALDPEELAIMRRHTQRGAAILTREPGLQAVATIVRCHHEWWDGTGYPHGIAGTQIPIASRVVSVCDAYDAMTTDRPYSDALPGRRAVEELREGAGTQFDPALVELLGGIVDRRRGSHQREPLPLSPGGEGAVAGGRARRA